MKRKKFIALAVIFVILISCSVIAYAQKDFFYSWSNDKQSLVLDHDKKVQVNEENAKNYKDSDRPKLDDKVTKDLENDIAAFPNVGTVEDIKIPGAEVPMPASIQSQYNFTSKGISMYNFVIVGNKVDNPDEGIIVNIYDRPKTGESQRYFISVPDVGKITLTGISSDKKIFTFKTDKGKTGTFDVSSKEGKYKID
jgi:hypothetical protein